MIALPARLLLLAGSSIALAGCFGRNAVVCEDPSLYGYSGSAPPMRVPEGLDLPDETRALQIPPGDEFVVRDPRTISECLEAPPDFFEDD